MAIIEVSASNAVIFNQQALTNIKVLTVSQSVSFRSNGGSHTNWRNLNNTLPLRGVARVSYGRYNGNVSSSLNISQGTHPRSHIESANNRLLLTQSTTRPKYNVVSHTIHLGQLVSLQRARGAFNPLNLVQIVTLKVFRTLVPFNTLNIRQGVSVFKVDKTYVITSDPLPTPPPVVPVTLLNENQVPPPNGIYISSTSPPLQNYSNSIVTATSNNVRIVRKVFFKYEDNNTWLALPRPELDNDKRFDFTRINRRSRGNDLIVFRDNAWPRTKTLTLTFSWLRRELIDGILYFLDLTLGKQVKYYDHYGKTWNGFIMTPAAHIQEATTNDRTITLEYQGVEI
jgi:hypothetical protein